MSTVGVMALPIAARAQTPSSMVKSASMSISGSKPGFAGKWTCMSSTIVEIAPVSYDTRGMASAWVMVLRDNGEVIAAERVSDREVEQLRSLPCGTPESGLGGVALVG